MDKTKLEVINFTNVSDKEWTHTWGGKPYTFAPGQTKAFPRFMAEFFAKHLSDRILIDAGKDFSMESKERTELMKKILGMVAVPAEEVTQEVAYKEPEFEDKPVEELEVYEKPAEPSAEATAEPKKRGRKKVA